MGRMLHKEINQKSSVTVNQHRDCRPHLQIQHLLSGVVDEVAGQGSRCGAVGQDDRVFGVLAPLDEEFSGKARLEVWLAAKHHLGAGHPGQVCQTVAQGQVTELEGVVSLVFETPHELITHPLHLQKDSRLTNRLVKRNVDIICCYVSVPRQIHVIVYIYCIWLKK